MNRQYSKDGLLKQYQQEAIDNRNRKNNEKQTRLTEERQALDNLNRALEQEKRQEQYVKMQRQNEYIDEYNKVLNKKKLDERGRLKNKNDYTGTFKIGGESREIRKRNYEEITNSLPMNPTRQETDYSHGNRYPDERQANNSIRQRGKSHGYNIINNYDERSPVQNFPQFTQNNQGINDNQTYARVPKLSKQEQAENIYEKYNTLDNYQSNGHSNVVEPRIENQNSNKHQDEVPQENNEYDEAEFQKYYENYIKQRMGDMNQGENLNENNKQNQQEEHQQVHSNEMNINSREQIPNHMDSRYMGQNEELMNQQNVFFT
jgi:hypothetical protein